MFRLKELLFKNSIGASYLYFYVHFILEVVCYFVLYSLIGNSFLLWIIPLIYDAVAFVPQSIIGYINDKCPKFNMGMVGIILLMIGVLLFFTNFNIYLSIVILCLGNACLHISGAEITLKSSNGKLTHSAIFVAGGSFGIVTGRILAQINLPWWTMIILVLTMIPFILLAEYYKKDDKTCFNFNYNSTSISKGIILILAIIAVIIRGYMGYGIPTSWNQTLLQTFFLYVFMGVGKILGGILADLFGVKKIAIISTLIGLPFILFGDNYMIISLIGVAIFSMTMPITLGVIVSILKNTPGLAFGLTTIGLFLGTLPTFFFEFTTVKSNNILIIVFTVLCLFIFSLILRKDSKNE